MDMDLVTESLYLGKEVGEISISQLKPDIFNFSCLQVNSHDNDATGLRVHAGAHTLIRFLICYKFLFCGKSCCEIGTGSGLVGIISAKYINDLSIILTDGDPRAIELAKINANILGLKNNPKLHVASLDWGDQTGMNEYRFNILSIIFAAINY